MQQTVPEDDTLKLSVAQAPVVRLDTVGLVQTSTGWLEAFKQVLPIYIATHIVFLALTYLATLFKLGNFSGRALPLPILLSS